MRGAWRLHKNIKKVESVLPTRQNRFFFVLTRGIYTLDGCKPRSGIRIGLCVIWLLESEKRNAIIMIEWCVYEQFVKEDLEESPLDRFNDRQV